MEKKISKANNIHTRAGEKERKRNKEKRRMSKATKKHGRTGGKRERRIREDGKSVIQTYIEGKERKEKDG